MVFNAIVEEKKKTENIYTLYKAVPLSRFSRISFVYLS